MADSFTSAGINVKFNFQVQTLNDKQFHHCVIVAIYS